jgi:hypothetical protein
MGLVEKYKTDPVQPERTVVDLELMKLKDELYEACIPLGKKINEIFNKVPNNKIKEFERLIESDPRCKEMEKMSANIPV